MEEKELRDILRGIVESAKTTQEQRDMLRKECKERGIKLNTKCKSCYIDAAVQIYNILPKDEPETERVYELKDGVDVMYGSTHVCEAIMTDELAERLLASGFPKYLFKKIPE